MQLCNRMHMCTCHSYTCPSPYPKAPHDPPLCPRTHTYISFLVRLSYFVLLPIPYHHFPLGSPIMSTFFVKYFRPPPSPFVSSLFCHTFILDFLGHVALFLLRANWTTMTTTLSFICRYAQNSYTTQLYINWRWVYEAKFDHHHSCPSWVLVGKGSCS